MAGKKPPFIAKKIADAKAAADKAAADKADAKPETGGLKGAAEKAPAFGSPAWRAKYSKK